jgi:hypothetical protein
MARFLKTLAGLVLGAVAGAALALALSELAAWYFDISQMEGAYAMGVVFFYMPLGAIIGGIAGAIWVAIKTSKGTR